MKGILKNQIGSTLTSILLATTLIGGMAFVAQKSQMRNTLNWEHSQREEGKFLVEKLKSLSMFLVSSNAIICKEGKFTGSSKENVCKWSGYQYVSGGLEPIYEKNLGLSDPTYEDGFLVYNIDTSKIVTEEEISNSDYDLSDIKGRIAFKLYDLADDDLNIAQNFPDVKVESLAVDGDLTAVLGKVEFTYNIRYSNNSSVDSDGKTVNSKKKLFDQKVVQYFAVRRPMALLELSINSATCKASCQSSLGLNNNPECRSNQSFVNNSESSISGEVKNLGPGVIYSAVVEKRIKYDKDLYPDLDNPDAVGVDLMPNKDFLLPGETAVWSDSLKCLSFKTADNPKIICSRNNLDSNNNPICYVSETQPREYVDFADKEGMSAALSQHTQPAGKVYYVLNVGRLHKDYTSIEKRALPFNGKLTVPLTSEVPSQYKNPDNLSNIEPARLITDIDLSSDIPQKNDSMSYSGIEIIMTH